MHVEQGSMLGMVRFHLLAHLAPTGITLSILYHVDPPVGLQESALHLPCTRVSSSREVVLMAQNTLSYLCWHPSNAAISPQSSAVPHPSIVELIWLAYMYCTIFLE